MEDKINYLFEEERKLEMDIVINKKKFQMQRENALRSRDVNYATDADRVFVDLLLKTIDTEEKAVISRLNSKIKELEIEISLLKAQTKAMQITDETLRDKYASDMSQKEMSIKSYKLKNEKHMLQLELEHTESIIHLNSFQARAGKIFGKEVDTKEIDEFLRNYDMYTVTPIREKLITLEYELEMLKVDSLSNALPSDMIR